MGSEPELKLPTIDFSIEDLEFNVAKWELVKSQVHKALVEYGCFEALFDKVPLDLRKAIFLQVEEMFDLPLQTKQRVVSSRPYHGYVGPLQLYENMVIDDVDNHDSGKFNQDLMATRKTNKNLQSFTEQVTRLDRIIRKMILESLGKIYGRAHELNKLPCTAYQAWTNGRVHTPNHRVMMSGNETRFTIGLFTVPKPGFIIKAPEELVTEEHPLLFKPFVQSEFMKFLHSSESTKNALKVYC
ncbi:probable 2-oxoglutarate-dependent dioxygenase AOP1 [Glycine max]|uniref:probable 2-oxoglutarate-dependent dioxygenase AOP1 n=1 Tax=Glycine max TaxID=3847 RepID=UPI000E21B897|nr:probable 2-oxoglutarate-dependent dioxygenase AOP1 [Glycine max]|eukprot:XP_025983817.1 probable 2-oxoglutarate-dependent dioxygenase AOP1 [Glycine max]